jgi:hypothetical protein
MIRSYPVRMGTRLDEADETAVQALQRRYAQITAWVVRNNRAYEPARAPEPARHGSGPDGSTRRDIANPPGRNSPACPGLSAAYPQARKQESVCSNSDLLRTNSQAAANHACY